MRPRTAIVIIAILTGLVVADLVFYWYAIPGGYQRIYAENALLENFQVALLLAAVVTGLWWVPRRDPLLRITGWGFAVLGLSFCLREVDVERLTLPLPAALLWAGHGFGRNLLLTICWSGLLWKFVRDFAIIKPRLGAVRHSPSARGVIVAGALLLVSTLFDKKYLGGGAHTLYEELLEMNAYVLLLLAVAVCPRSFAGAEYRAPWPGARRGVIIPTAMTTPGQIRGWIETALPEAEVEVRGDGRPFEAVIVHADFAGKSLIQRHQMVCAALGDRVKAQIHALSMKTLTPEERRAAGAP